MTETKASSLYNFGNINSVYTESKSTTAIFNEGNIESIYNSKKSDTFITNKGSIGEIHNDTKGYMTIANYGSIGTVHNKAKRAIDISNNDAYIGETYGKVEYPKKLGTFLTRFENSFILNMEIWAANFEDSFDMFMNDTTYADESVDKLFKNIESMLQMTGIDIIMKTGESFKAWKNKFNSSSDLEKVDMLADLTAGGVRAYGMAYIAKEVSSVLAPKGMSKTAKGYRYVSEGELNVIKRTGTIPNTDRAGNLKDVFVSPEKYDTVAGAEKGLQIGKQNPFGATESPMYRVEFNMNAVKYRYGGNVEGGVGIELITEQPIPVDLSKIFELK